MSDQQAQARVGQVVAGKYRLEKLLGAGGMGAVYAATHLFTKRAVAVKLMHRSLSDSAVFAERFVREAQAPSTIGHPGIVEVLDGGFAEGNELYLVLEMLQGKTLGELETPLPIPDLVDVSKQLLDALGAAHKAGFVHRDIKPDNVFLTHDATGRRKVKLLDFGVAGFRGSSAASPQLTQTGTVLGTATFMSPEQAKGDRVDQRSDLWAVGALIYDALAGRPPFDADTYNAVIVSIVTREHVPLANLRPDLPRALLEVIERALRKDLTERWQTAADMAAALSAIKNLEALSGVSTKPGAQAASDAVAATRLARPERAPSASATFTPRSTAIPPKAEDASPQAKLWIGGATLTIALALGLAFTMRANRRPSLEPSIAPPVAFAAADPPVVDAPPRHVDPTPTAATPTDAPPAQLDMPTPPTASPATPAPIAPINSDDLARMLTVTQAQLQRCYQSALTAELVAGGSAPATVSLDVTLTVVPSGEVRDAAITGKASEPLRKCLRDHLRTVRFRATSETAEVNFPVIFQPSIIGN